MIPNYNTCPFCHITTITEPMHDFIQCADLHDYDIDASSSGPAYTNYLKNIKSAYTTCLVDSGIAIIVPKDSITVGMFSIVSILTPNSISALLMKVVKNDLSQNAFEKIVYKSIDVFKVRQKILTILTMLSSYCRISKTNDLDIELNMLLDNIISTGVEEQ